MSMPVIAAPENPISIHQAVTDLIESIALEETALSHILNAEGEKIQKIIALENADSCRILEVNDSVVSMIGAVSDLEAILKDKLEFVANNLFYPAQ